MAKKPAHRKRMMKEKKEFEEEVLQVDRVTRVVKGGRRLSFRATVIIGNRKGKVAVGLGKATEVTAAIQKAVNRAKKNILLVPIVKETIPHEVKVKYKANYLLLIPASPGTGIKAGSSTRKILELAGIKNILSKRMGSSNRVNLAKATMKALEKLTEKVEPKELKEDPKDNKKAGKIPGKKRPAPKKAAPKKPAAKKDDEKAPKEADKAAEKSEKPATDEAKES